MSRILHLQHKPSALRRSALAALVLASAAWAMWWLAGPPAASPPKKPDPHLPLAQVWPAMGSNQAAEPPPPRPVIAQVAAPTASVRDAPDTRERNADIAVAQLTTSRPLAADAFLQEVLLKAQPRGGFVVQEVEPGGIYDKMGLRRSDVIYSLDTPAMSEVDENSMISLMQQTQIEINIYRDGTLIALRRALNVDEEPAPAEQR